MIILIIQKAKSHILHIHFIKDALSFWGLSNNVEDIIRTVIFDAIIGNSDRHQENWGFISPYKEHTFTEDEAVGVLRKLKEKFKQISELVKRKDIKEKDIESVNVKIFQLNGRYAPIYDSGCCFAREKNENDIRNMLANEAMIEGFINRGKSEIHWGKEGKKLNHFELIKKIRQEYAQMVDDIIAKVLLNYNKDMIRDIVYNIDDELPDDLKSNNSLSTERKELICKLIDERIKRLKDIVS